MSNRIELGARKDTSDGEEGAGADMAAEIRYVSPESGWEIKGRVSALLLHSQSGFREWGAGMGFTYAPDPEGRGVSMSFEPIWNVPRAGVVETMWGTQDLDVYGKCEEGVVVSSERLDHAGRQVSF